MDKQIAFNALRVFEAISKIGYKPHSAIADIIDNAVSAKATSIKVVIDLIPGTTLVKHRNIERIYILDNGKGMDDAGIENSLTLGSTNDYEKDSLSKYGMGLKSAGFSLGKKIIVTSKLKSNKVISSWYLDLDNLNSGYTITKTEENDLPIMQLNEHIKGFKSYTIIEITKCPNRLFDSAKKIKDELERRLGVTYFPKLKNSELSIDIYLRRDKEVVENVSILPKDILFTNSIIKNEFSKEDYDGKNPIRVFKEEIDLKGVERKANLEIVIFPKDEMKGNVQFTEEERNLIKSFEVGTKNMGFFIYRNNRLISWGDRLLNGSDGKKLVPRDLFGFRAVFNIYSEHDEILNVDVSKQHLDIPDEIIETIELLTRNPKIFAREAFSKCTELFNSETAGEEGENFTEKNKYVTEQDQDEENETEKKEFKIDKAEAEQRKNKLTSKPAINKGTEVNSRKKSSKVTKPNPAGQGENVDSVEKFLKVRYSYEADPKRFITSGFNAEYGVFAIVNKNHPYYSTIIERLVGKSDVKESIEALIWAYASAEHLTLQNLTSLTQQEIETVLTKFQRTFSYNLDNWTTNNFDLKLQ